MRASGKPTRYAVRQAASRSVERRACPRSDMDQPLLPLPVRGTAFRRHRVSGCCPSYILWCPWADHDGFYNAGSPEVYSRMLNHGYLAQTLRRPLPTKDGWTLRTLADAANYILALPEDRRRTHWDRTVHLLLDMADPSEISRQLELALFYDRQLNLKMPTST